MRIKKFSDFSLSRSGVRSQISPDIWWGAYFRLDHDIRDLFPFINAEIKESKYQNNPEHIQFDIYGARCTLYPREVIAAAFQDEEHARQFAESLILFLNDLDDKKTSIKPEFKAYQTVSPIDIYRLLPKTNCRKCGYQSCIAFAAAASRGLATPDACPDFASPLYVQAVYPIYGKDGKINGTFSVETASGRSGGSLNSTDKQKSFQAETASPDAPADTNLTDREIEVLRLASEGMTNVDISKTLDISPHTVKSHIIHIFNKLGVNDRTQAAVRAVRQKIL